MSSSRQLLPAAATAAALLVAVSFMGSAAPPGFGFSHSGPAVILVDDDNCPGPGSGAG